MKNFFILVLFMTLVAQFVQAADYVAQVDDTIDIIAKKTESTVEQLKQLNPNINSADLRQGDMVHYISKSDMQDAANWLEEYILGLKESDVEYASFTQMYKDVLSGDIVYGNEPGTEASEVLTFSDAWQAR